MGDEDPRITRARSYNLYPGSVKETGQQIVGECLAMIVENKWTRETLARRVKAAEAERDTQVAVHRHTSEDLQAWRRRAQAAEAELSRVRVELSTWLTIATGMAYQTERWADELDPYLLALRDWVDSGFLGEAPSHE